MEAKSEKAESFTPIIQWDGENFICKLINEDLTKEKNKRLATHKEIFAWFYEYSELEKGAYDELECFVKYQEMYR